jgi:hypothetical protein
MACSGGGRQWCGAGACVVAAVAAVAAVSPPSNSSWSEGHDAMPFVATGTSKHGANHMRSAGDGDGDDGRGGNSLRGLSSLQVDCTGSDSTKQVLSARNRAMAWCVISGIFFLFFYFFIFFLDNFLCNSWHRRLTLCYRSVSAFHI